MGFQLVALGGDARRQYINSRDACHALNAAVYEARRFEGRMFFRIQHGREYLVHELRRGGQKGLGPRSSETEVIYKDFHSRKSELGDRISSLQNKLKTCAQLNCIHSLNRVDELLVGVLRQFQRFGLGDKICVIDTNALWAYEAMAGVRVFHTDAPPFDFDFLNIAQNSLTCAITEKVSRTSFLGMLKAVDKTFKHERGSQRFSVVNERGFRLRMIEALATTTLQSANASGIHMGSRLTTQVDGVDWLLNAPKVDTMIVGEKGTMVQMRVVDPRALLLFDLRIAEQRLTTDDAGSGLHRARLLLDICEGYLPNFPLEGLRGDIDRLRAST